jgi:hypothetical protein
MEGVDTIDSIIGTGARKRKIDDELGTLDSNPIKSARISSLPINVQTIKSLPFRTAVVLITDDDFGLCGGCFDFQSPKETLEWIIGDCLKEHYRYGARKLDLDNGTLEYNKTLTDHCSLCHLVIYVTTCTDPDCFIDIINLDPYKVNEQKTRSGFFTFQRIPYSDFLKLVD